jgi:FtsZ-binding cell division protein ZapB
LALLQSANSITLPQLPAAFPPRAAIACSSSIQILFGEGRRMTRKNNWAILAMAVVLSFHLIACKDAKTLQENEQLKVHVADLQKENGQVGNDLESMTAARDALSKENEKLKAEIKALKTKSHGKKAASRKRRRG